jgi:alkanesulfonate monooxygenase SsuD/methylene tetrahydromethanopterin reductase-like flavin-dependent oxidoreductase (luciferase family)
MVRTGIIILPDLPWREAKHRWIRAEEYGFAHAWTYDHIGWRTLVDGPWFDSVPTLAAAALHTSRIRLGTMVASPNFRHPVHFAREVTALDDLSEGRLSLGLGSGGTGYDASVLGQEPLPPRKRADRFAEFVGLLDVLLREGEATVDGEFFSAADARSAPGCLQRPRVPFVVAANGPRAMRLAARHGQGWVTNGGQAEDMKQWWANVSTAMARFQELGTSLDTYLSLDPAPVFSLSSVDYFDEVRGRAGQLGFTDVITHWPRPAGPFAGPEEILDRLTLS